MNNTVYCAPTCAPTKGSGRGGSGDQQSVNLVADYFAKKGCTVQPTQERFDPIDLWVKTPSGKTIAVEVKARSPEYATRYNDVLVEQSKLDALIASIDAGKADYGVVVALFGSLVRTAIITKDSRPSSTAFFTFGPGSTLSDVGTRKKILKRYAAIKEYAEYTINTTGEWIKIVGKNQPID